MADCITCSGTCCKYVTVTIDPPEEDIDFEELKWYLCHENIIVYVDHEGDWCVEFSTPCKYQDKKTNLCTIYGKKPKVCSDHLADECENNKDFEEYYTRIFRTTEDIEAYRKEIQSRPQAQKFRQQGNAKASAAE